MLAIFTRTWHSPRAHRRREAMAARAITSRRTRITDRPKANGDVCADRTITSRHAGTGGIMPCRTPCRSASAAQSIRAVRRGGPPLPHGLCFRTAGGGVEAHSGSAAEVEPQVDRLVEAQLRDVDARLADLRLLERALVRYLRAGSASTETSQRRSGRRAGPSRAFHTRRCGGTASS
jgi:hypothetical protein